MEKNWTKEEANRRFLILLEEGIPYFQILTDKYRQQIVVMLSETDEMNVSAIANRISLSRTAVSHHLKLLRQAGLVTSDKRGKEIFFKLILDKPLQLLKELTFIIENYCTVRK
jgi:DNA-binding transcriptional ArsR family regulator